MITVACYYFPNYHPSTGAIRSSRARGGPSGSWSRRLGLGFPGIVSLRCRHGDTPTNRTRGRWLRRSTRPRTMGSMPSSLTGTGTTTDLLGRGLEQGFLKAPNRDRLRFSVMWANHDWIDIHPYTRGEPARLLYPGKISPKTFEELGAHCIETYFKKPVLLVDRRQAVFLDLRAQQAGGELRVRAGHPTGPGPVPGQG